MTQEREPLLNERLEAARNLMTREAELPLELATLQEALGIRIDLQVLLLDKALANLTDEKKQTLDEIAQRYIATCNETSPGIRRPPREEEKEYHTFLYEGVDQTLTEYFEFYWRLSPRIQDPIPGFWNRYFEEKWNEVDRKRMEELNPAVKSGDVETIHQNLLARSKESTIRKMGLVR